jgi:hypothetical protein
MQPRVDISVTILSRFFVPHFYPAVYLLVARLAVVGLKPTGSIHIHRLSIARSGSVPSNPASAPIVTCAIFKTGDLCTADVQLLYARSIQPPSHSHSSSSQDQWSTKFPDHIIPQAGHPQNAQAYHRAVHHRSVVIELYPHHTAPKNDALVVFICS